MLDELLAAVAMMPLRAMHDNAAKTPCRKGLSHESVNDGIRLKSPYRRQRIPSSSRPSGGHDGSRRGVGLADIENRRAALIAQPSCLRGGAQSGVENDIVGHAISSSRVNFDIYFDSENRSPSYLSPTETIEKN